MMEHPPHLQTADPSKVLKAGLGCSDRAKPHHWCGASTRLFYINIIIAVSDLPLTDRGSLGSLMGKLLVQDV